MKTLYLKTTMKLLRLLPVLIFFLLALSYNARSQAVFPASPICYGEPIQLLCNYTAGCNNPIATFRWENFSGSWSSSLRDPVLYAPGTPMPAGPCDYNNPLTCPGAGQTYTGGLCNGEGYGTDKFYLSMQYYPPPGGFFGGRVTVVVLAPIVITGNVTPVVCFGGNTGSIDITVAGGLFPYTYAWSNGATTQDLTGLTAGTYYVTVTDSKPCSQISYGFVITEPTIPFLVSGIPTDALCNGGSTGSIDLTPVGGTAPFTYLWSNGAITEDISGLAAGTYYVTATDANNCLAYGNWTVGQPQSPLQVSAEYFNVSCFGGSDGSIMAYGSGGTQPYSYAWSNGHIGAYMGGLTAGCYTVTVTDNNLCTVTGSYCITQPDLLVGTGVVTDASCFGDCDGMIDLSVAGGTAPYGYLWSDGSITEDISGLCAGVTYAVTITDAHNCMAYGTWTIGSPTPVTVTGTPVDGLCYESCDGSISIIPGGGTPPYTYNWSNGYTGQNPGGLCAGQYSVTVMDANDCFAYGQWTVGAPPMLYVAGSVTDALCNQSCDGAISITPSGGTAPYAFAWSNGFFTQNISALCAGDYTVTVTDAQNCTVVGNWTVAEPGEISWVGSTTSVTCFGLCNGTITEVSIDGGTPPYTYLWSNGATTKDLTGLCAGSYYLTVTDAHSCDARPFQFIYEPPVLVIDPVAVITPATCYGGGGGAIEITVTGGTEPYSFLWTNNATTQNISGLTAGCYTVTVTDANNCMDTESFCVTQPDPIMAMLDPMDASCYEYCDGMLHIMGITGGNGGPYTFLWSNGATTQDIMNLCAGTYTVTVSDGNNCTGIFSGTVGQPDMLDVTAMVVDALCNQSCDGYINLTPSGGTAPYAFAWSTGSTGQNINALCAGDYSVTITDSHFCTLVDSWTVAEPGEISWVGSTTSVTCFGLCNGTITEVSVDGGTPPYTYLWSNGATTKDLTGLCAGSYYLTVTDSHSCDARPFQFIYEPPVLVVDPIAVITPAYCFNGTGGTIDITVTGGTMPYGYLWSNNATTEDLVGLSAGCYTVTVTDANNCVATGSFCVGQPDPIVVTDDVFNVSCKGYCDGALDISVTGGTPPYYYSWSNGATDQDISGLCEGTYTVIVYDYYYCQGTNTFTVGAPDALDVTAVATDALCNQSCDGFINITPSGGTAPYAFAWSNGFTTQNISALCAGDYAVTITDSHLCTLVDSWTVGEPGEISWVGSTTDVTCFGLCNGTITEVSIDGGTPPYTYLWSNGATTKDLTGLCAGSYYLTVTDAHSCDARPFQFIYEPPVLSIDPIAVITPALCNGGTGGSIEITVTGGTLPYSFLWTNNATTQNISGLSAGCYTVTVTDANNCMDTESFCVGEPDPIMATVTPIDVLCYGDCNGMINVTNVTGGTAPYGFAWSNGAMTQNVMGLCEGTYTVTITDAHSCEKVYNATVGAPLPLDVTGTATNSLCKESCDGFINIIPSGGTAPYGFVWSNGFTTQNIGALCAGDYTVTITDTHNCTLVDSWYVGEPGEISWVGSTTDVTCFGLCNGTITEVSIDGGTPPYTYMWSNGATTKDLTGLCAGTYYLTVTDAHSCDARPFQFIYEPELLVVSLNTPVVNVSCFGLYDGSIDIAVTGGTMPYIYLWSNNATTEDLTGLAAGCYTVTITDAQNCMTTGSFCVTQPDLLTVSGTKTDAVCYGDCNGTIDLTVVGGTMPYYFAWSNLATTEDLTGLCAGTYFVTVTDAHSCETYDYFMISQPDELVIGEPVVTNVTCNGASNGSINGGIITGVPPVILPIPVTGGTPPYSYIWSNGVTLDNLCCLPAGCYTVTVTDTHGCQDISSWCITEPPALTLEASVTSVACNGGLTGAINLTVTGGTLPIQSYTWSNGATIEDLSGLGAGVYTVTVLDYNGCLATGSWTILEPTDLVVTLVDITNVSCFGLADGAIEITVTGGTMPYSFLWSTTATTQNISGLAAGCYTVTVTDANGCTETGSWCVTEPPALSLEGSVTSVVCYQGNTGAIDITVTGGTPAYLYYWSNGATTEDLTGLVAGIYTVTVEDAHSCQISDSYEVLEPPMWTVNLEGPTAVCCNTDETAHYYASVSGAVPNCPVTYEWVVTGGIIVGGWNTAHIEVDWECCTVGTVKVKATACTCTSVSTLTVAVSLPPAPVIVGPATVYSNGTDTYCVTPNMPGYLYTWTVVNGSYTTAPNNCIDVTWNSYPACGCGIIIVCVTDPVTGCVGCDTLYITMLPDPNSISIQGTVSYKNGLPNTPLNGVTVKLRDLNSGLIIGTTVTGPNMNPPLYTGDPGYYAFTNVAAGNYRLESTFNGTWGGNNATDALLIQLEAGAAPGTYLNGLFRVVADVNASLTVTALDALYVKLRTVGSISSYPAGDWAFEQPLVSVPVVGMVDFAGLCEGDVNGSYIPTGMKSVSFLSVIDNETQTVPVEETFAYEIRSNMVAQLGAMTLFMGYDKDRFEVIDVTASSNDEMKYVIEDGNVAIAWADTKPMSVRNDDQIFTLTVKAKTPLYEPTQIFNVRAGSEFANPTGTRYDNFDLKMSKVITAGSSSEFSIFNYPNPFNVSTKIVYTIPESGKVTLVITDMFGKTVRTLVDDVQEAGTYSIPVNAAELNLTSGVYLYRIEAAGTTDTYVKVNKMVFAR